MCRVDRRTDDDADDREVGHASQEATAVEINGFRGQLITADHADYDDARAVWNGAIDRHPRLIARCSGTADVAAAVRFARDHGLEVAVRGGGHNVAGTAVCDDGIVIDLSEMRAVWVEPASRTAWVQGGALWGDVDHETQVHGLATTGGIVSHTGVAGLTLGGGIGWLMRKHGLTVDNLLAAHVVTAEGEMLRVSEDEHPDLFWALRGGGGNFGVVTSFDFRLHPVGPDVLAGPILWDAADTDKVLRFYRDFVHDAPDELGTVVRFGTAPPLPVIPEDLHWRPVVIVASCYAGPMEEAEGVLRPLRAFGAPLLDLVAPTPYVDHQSGLDSTVRHGWNYYWKSTYLPELSDDLVNVITEHAFAARRRARTRSCSTWEARSAACPEATRRSGTDRRRTPSRSTPCGSRAKTTVTKTSPGRGGSSPPSTASATASTSTSSAPTRSLTGSARRTETPSTTGWRA